MQQHLFENALTLGVQQLFERRSGSALRHGANGAIEIEVYLGRCRDLDLEPYLGRWRDF